LVDISGQEIKLNLNEEKNADLNQDGEDDISLLVGKIKNSRPYITIRELKSKEPILEPKEEKNYLIWIILAILGLILIIAYILSSKKLKSKIFKK